MAVLKCKMCGGDLNIVEGETVAVCEYCDTKQTVPTVDNEKKMTLFSRANRLRAACEFDKASGIYENIVSEFPEEAEAYWGLLLCKYGIEYVDDPATGRKIPTCHRSSFDSIMDDENFEQVMENSDPVARKVYREEAKTIEDIRKGILEVSSKEEPYDIFICYKETDENGERTIDSVLAQDIYDMLTEHDYRVFFARITLEDKLGQEYEPYIFAALNSAKIMLAIGTDYEYYNAVWVKNEWSRFLQLMTHDSKKTLIPCFKNLDAYDIPKEFVRLQAQDLGKIGAMQDLLRGIQKLIPKNKPQATVIEKTIVTSNEISDRTTPLLERAYMFIEDGEWDNANDYFERVLDIEPKKSQAYLGKLLIEYKCHSLQELISSDNNYDESNNYSKIIRFGDDDLKKELENGLVEAKKRYELKVNNQKYEYAKSLMQKARTIKDYKTAADSFRLLGDFKDSKQLAEECSNKEKSTETFEEDYKEAISLMSSSTVIVLQKALEIFKGLEGFKDAEEKALICQNRIDQIKVQDQERQKNIQIANLESKKRELQKEYDKLDSWWSSDQKKKIKKSIDEIEFKIYQLKCKK
ncbi:MAG: toll/interleukin-1 receptor domain-containing protein [Ruminococcus sp.]|nr:toll/interleukin-1 receptor domain-containing protein [Ruminococcus sp.]